MTGLTYRNTKGSPLTYDELDGNFSNLDGRTRIEGWDDQPLEVTVPAGGPNVPTWSNFRDGLYGWSFSPSTMNECWGNIHILHNYDETGGAYPGMIYPHIHWSANTTATGVVRFGIEYSAARRDDAGTPGTVIYGPTTTIYVEHEIATSEQYQHQVSEPTDGNGIPLATQLMVDAVIKCRFFRDATHPNDTFPDAVFLDKVDAHIPVYANATVNRQYPFS